MGMYQKADRYPVKNIKTGQLYTVCGDCKNCTNAQDGQMMILYFTRGVPAELFSREKGEFEMKFQRLPVKQ